MSISFYFLHTVAVSVFMICRGLCACTEMFWMCVLYVSLGALPWVVLVCFRYILLLYSAGSGVNKVQVVLFGFSVILFCFVQEKTVCRYGCIYFLAALVLVCVDVFFFLFSFT